LNANTVLDIPMKRQTLPTLMQAQWLRRIAQSPLMVTHTPGEETRYSLQNGTTVPRPTAETLIRKGWLKAERDGLFDLPQSYRVLTSH
jgi:hypothetical protein